jgi:hypothetical protein
MSPDDPISRLEAFGYTARQAAFLRLVLLFGGYFVRRHATTFFGGGDGGVTTEFVRALVSRRHATCSTYRRKTQVVHVFGKRLYAALGEPENRNRRAVEPATILRKLLTLDVVLGHRQERFLATTREKVAFFQRAGIPLHALPTTRYRPRRGPGPAAVRHFVDKAPIWVSDDWTRVVFAYVRTPIEGLDGLKTWLAAYARLLARLPEPCLFLVAASEAEASESVAAATTVLRTMRLDTTPGLEDWRASVEQYFEARRRLDLADPGCMTTDELAQLRAARAQFPDDVYDPLYTTYLAWGPMALSNLPPAPTVQTLTHVAVTREVIPVRYELFGTARRRQLDASSARTMPRIGGIDVSAEPAA